MTDRDLTPPHGIPLGLDADSYERGYDDGYCAAQDDEDAVDARNRARLDELRDDLADACREWREPVATQTPAWRMHDAAMRLVAHTAPRSDR